MCVCFLHVIAKKFAYFLLADMLHAEHFVLVKHSNAKFLESVLYHDKRVAHKEI